MELTAEQLAAKAAAEAELRKAQPESNTYVVLRPTLHDTTEFTAGDEVVMTPRQAQHLVATKAIALKTGQIRSIEPVDLTQPKSAADLAYDTFMTTTNGGRDAKPEEWQTVGRDKTGAPVPKGSENDATPTDLRFPRARNRQNS